MAKTAQQYLDQEEKLNSRRSFWLNQWQLVAEYVHQRRADFTTSRQPGAFINSQLWTDEPVHMAETCASALLGYIWSGGVKSFKLVGNKKVFGKDKDMADFWAETTESLQDEMNDQDAGLSVAMDESMLDLVTLGTDAIVTEERNQEKPLQGCLLFDAWTIQQFALAEDAAGRAAKFSRRREFTIENLVSKYGLENVSAASRKKFLDGNLQDTVQVLHCIEPRLENDRAPGSKAAKDMPIASVHIEVEAKKFLKRSGYHEQPVACARLAKRVNEEYGRGRGMNALSSIMMLNQVMEDWMLAMEKNLDPPMYQIHDAVAGNGYIDTSAGAITILRMDKAMPNVPPTGKLYDIQEIRNAPQVIEMLLASISKHFMIDRLIDLNNDVEMTKGEAFLRNGIRQASLRSPVSRILLEKFDPLINTSFAICLRRNKFGYMPGDPAAAALEAQGIKVKYLPQKLLDAIARDEDLYTIEYLTPAARDMLAEEGQGMVETLAVAGEMAAFDNTIKHRIDATWTLGRIAEIKGADRRMFKKEADAQASIQQEQQMQQQAMQAELLKATSGVAKDAAVANNAMKSKA